MNPTEPTTINPPPRPGWQTSEFWMTLLSNFGLLLAAGAGAVPAKYAAIAAAASQVAYNLSRGLAKQQTAAAARPSSPE